MGYFSQNNARYKDELSKYRDASALKQWHITSSRNTYSLLSDSVRKGSESVRSFGRSLFQRSGETKNKVFAEDYKTSKLIIVDPNKNFARQWNKIFLLSCLVALFLDPFFFFVPALAKDNKCINLRRQLLVVVTTLRTVTDAFHLFHMALQFRMAFVAPSSRVFGRGILVVDSMSIAMRYLRKDFWLDIISVLPIPQVVIWIIVPSSKGPLEYNTKNALRFIVFLQYIPRLYLIFPLLSQIVKTTGVVTETAWAGAAYNLLLYMLGSHFIGACWYLLAIERKDACWRQQCGNSTASAIPCQYNYLYCSARNVTSEWQSWQSSTTIFDNCQSDSTLFDFGIYKNAFDKHILDSNFVKKYLYCLWFGLQQLSSLGQNLQTSTFIGELVFAIFIAILGLVLFALLIGNMQTYLQSLGVRLEEWRVKQSDTEEWMQHRQLPPKLRERVRSFNQYKWVATRGVDEEGILKSLPPDLRRDIKRHLCLNLVLKVPLFKEMDAKLRDAICERLRPVLCTKFTVIMREGDPVNEMLFVVRGSLKSSSTDGGRAGYYNQIKVGPGEFCGEELVSWALDPKQSLNLPTSNRTIEAEGEVEAFALTAEDLKFVAKQFRLLHSKKLHQTFRFYSHPWRTWAAGFIQTAWKRYKKRKLLAELYSEEQMDANVSLGTTLFAARFAKNAMRGVNKLRENSSTTEDRFVKVPKPQDPDYGAYVEESHD